MEEPHEDPRTTPARQARTHALIVPREHGAWGLVLIPLLSGGAVGWAAGHHAGPILLFVIAVIALFWMRTPVESLLGTSAMSAHTPAERRIALIAAVLFGTVAATCLCGLMWGGKHRALWLLGVVAATAFVLQVFLKKLGRSMRMPSQMVGALGLTSTAAGAYYLASGHLGGAALGLWGANWIFAGNQIHFVHLHIHGVRAATFADKFRLGSWFFLGQATLIPLLAGAALEGITPGWLAAAFIPMLARGFYWFVRKPVPLQIKQLGWSEMKQGVIFGVLLTVVYVFGQ